MTKNEKIDAYNLQYDFIDNGAGDLMMVIESVDKEPQDSVFYYDGKKTGLFKRREDQIMSIPYLAKEVRDILSKNSKLVITEMDSDDEIAQTYLVPVEIPDNGKLPYPEEIQKEIDEFLNSIIEEEK